MKNSWDERYSSSDYVYGEQPNDFLMERITQLPKGGRVLCLAEGEGRNAVALARAGFQVVAVDFSAVGRAKALELARRSGVQIDYRLCDLSEWVWEPAPWDAIVSIFCHLPPPIRRKLYQQVPNHLRPGGVFLLEGYTPEQLNLLTGGPPTEELMLSTSVVEAELKGLKWIHLKEVRREIHEGQGHNGMSAVVQGLGVKPLTT